MHNLIPKDQELAVLFRDLQFVGMTSVFERAYYSWICEQHYQGLGEVVDLGCWLGSTSKSLLNGLLKNQAFSARATAKLHVFDQFLWQSWMDLSPVAIANNYAKKLKAGDSFLELFKSENLKQLEWYQIYAGDLCQASWNLPIEILLVDAMKSRDLMDAIPRIFYTHLIPQKSIVLHQDFGWDAIWCHLSVFLLKDYFKFIYFVPRSNTAVF